MSEPKTKKPTNEVGVLQDEVKDLSGANLTFAEQMKRYNTNKIELCATVTKLTESAPKMRTRKDENGKQVPVMVDGVPQFWDGKCYADISFEGGSMSLNFPISAITELQENERYLFTGRMGLNYGSIQAVFSSYIKVV